MMYSGIGSGSDDWPGYCGVKLLEVDQGNSTKLDFSHLVTPKVRREARVRVAKLPRNIRQACGEIGVWLVWSTS